LAKGVIGLSLEENRAIVRKAIEAINKHDLSLLDDIILPNYFDHIIKQQGLEWYKRSLTVLFKGFPDYHATIEDIIAEGDRVWARIAYAGTNTGEYLGLAPTGKKISYNSVTIKRIVDGKMVEGWTVNDMSDFFMRLGIVEHTEKGRKLLP